MKEEEDQPHFLYHSSGEREDLRDFLPLTLFLSAVLVGLMVVFVQVRMPHPVRPRGEGQIYYRNDELIHFQIRQRTPLPLNLPYYVDPARQEAAAAVENAVRVEAKPMSGPSFDFLFVAPDSVVLGEADLLALPPVSGSADQVHAVGTGEEGAEAEQSADGPAGAATEPAEEVEADAEEEEVEP